MPYSLYTSLNLRSLIPIKVVIQLADRSKIYPKRVVEDVLVQVNKLVFLADFYLPKIEGSPNSSPILLGRPLFKMART
jgi:hypothetical protein